MAAQVPSSTAALRGRGGSEAGVSEAVAVIGPNRPKSGMSVINDAWAV
jgi:hypothetical protein